MSFSCLVLWPALWAVLFLCGACRAAEDRKPNVLFIAVDDLRPELSCYGNTVIRCWRT